MVSEKTNKFIGNFFLWSGIIIAVIVVASLIWRNEDPCSIGTYNEATKKCEQPLTDGITTCPLNTILVQGEQPFCESAARNNAGLYWVLFIIAIGFFIKFFGKKVYHFFSHKKFQSAESIKSITPKQACIAFKQYYEQTFGKGYAPYLVEPMTPYFKNAKDGKSYEFCDCRAYFSDGTYLEPTLPLWRGEEAIRQGSFQQNKGHFFFFDQSKHRNMIPNQSRDPMDVLEKLYIQTDPDYLRKLQTEKIAKNILQDNAQEKEKEKA